MEKTLLIVLACFTLAVLATVPVVVQAEAEATLPNSWVSKSSMLTERIYFGAAAVNGLVYATGGIHYEMVNGKSTQAPTVVNEVYDPVSDTWSAKASMPTPLAKFGIAVYQNKIYCIGGTTNEVYDTSKDTWQTLSPMPTARTDVEASAVNGKIYVMGGKMTAANGSELFSTLNEVYDPDTDAWSERTAMPLPAPYCTSAAVGNKIYIISGASRDDPATAGTAGAVQAYDTQLDSWATLASIPVPVNNAAAATIQVSAHNVSDRESTAILFVMGGTTQSDPFHAINLTQMYYPKSDTWAVGTSLLYPRAALATATVDKTIFALGGGQHALFTPQSNTNQQYGPSVVQTPDNTSSTPTQTPTHTPSPSSMSSAPIDKPTMTPTQKPSLSPSVSPKDSPTQQPTVEFTGAVDASQNVDYAAATLLVVFCVGAVTIGVTKLRNRNKLSNGV